MSNSKWGQVRRIWSDNPWYAFDDLKPFFEAVKSGRWNWYNNSRFKYVDIRIDTRSGHIVIKDRDGNSVTMSELMGQYDRAAGGIVPLPGYTDPMEGD